MPLEDLLTLADRAEYYAAGARPWNEEGRERPVEKLSPDVNKAHDNIRKLLVENDKLLANQFALRKLLKRVIYWAGAAIVAAWMPLWVPLLMKWAGLK